MGGNGVRGRDMGVEREEADRESTGEIFEMADGSGMESVGIYDKGRNTEREIESQRRAWGFEESKGNDKEMLDRDEKESQSRGEIVRIGKGKARIFCGERSWEW